MAAPDSDATVRTVPPSGRSGTHLIVLGLIWLTMALSSVVFTEPAPFDLLMMGLVLLLPVVGMTSMTPRLLAYLGVWVIIAAFGFIGALYATDASKAATHTAITLYLSVASAIIAGFIVRNPGRHAQLIVSGLIAAGVIASFAGIIGYLNIVPGLTETLTKFDRARGFFKDPNVLGAFLTPIVVMALHMASRASGLRIVFPLAILALLCGGVLLSFSRSSWLTAVVCVTLYLYLSMTVTGSSRQRIRMSVLTFAGTLAAILVLLVAVQFDTFGSLLSERASLSQRYDLGPEGRFGGQWKAWTLILQNPMGIGSLEFRPIYHHEEPHNTFLSMFLNAGWIGGMLYLILTVGTVIYGFRFITKMGSAQDLFIVFYVGFVGTVLGGLVVDTDHWRHFYILMGVLWGFMLSHTDEAVSAPRRRTAFLNPAKS